MVTLQNPSRGPARHHLSAESFRVLAAGMGSSAITGELWRTEQSRRLLLVAALLDECVTHPDLLGPLPSGEAARDILGQAHRRRPNQVGSVLMHPQVGSWAAYALRRQRGGAVSSLPLWVDFGVAHALALVAAARAGLSWQTQLPVRGGELLLPTLGVARFLDATAPVAIAEARTMNGRIELAVGEARVTIPIDSLNDETETIIGANATGIAEWWGLRRLRTGGDLVLNVLLDDVDPYRDLADPVPAKRLDSVELNRWTALLTEAWAKLSKDHRLDAEAIADGVVSIVPLQADDGWGTRSASTGEAFGSVMMSLPPDATTMALTMVHEWQHIKLGGLMHLVPLTGEDDGRLYYAPWRDDPRPLGGLLQGVYAFLGIAAFWRRELEVTRGPDVSLAAFEYAHSRAQTTEALHLIRSAPGLTDAGGAFVEGLISRMSTWLDDAVPPEVVRLTSLTVDSHRIGWRLRHLRPDPEQVRGFATAWGNGEAAEGSSGPPMVAPHQELAWPQRMPALVRRRILAVTSHAPIGQQPPDVPASTLTAAEAALVAGDGSAAYEAFGWVIAAGDTVPGSADDVRAWTGLTLAVAATGEAAASVLTSRPDLVRAVYDELAGIGTAPDPVRLAAWLGTAITQTQPRRDADALARTA